MSTREGSSATEAHAPMTPGSSRSVNRRWLAAALAGAGVGVLDGMIGLGEAEFRLPLLIGMFGFLAAGTRTFASARRALSDTSEPTAHWPRRPPGPVARGLTRI